MIVLSIGGLAGLPAASAAAAPSLNVTNFGARGDAFDTLADTVQGSAVIHSAAHEPAFCR